MRGSQSAISGRSSVTCSIYPGRGPMSSKSRTKSRRMDAAGRSIALLVGFGALLGGCSDIYYDRRETVALGADDHIASNTVAQMVDPWPRYVGNKNIAFNGERMQSAVECYRHNPRVIHMIYPGTTAIVQQQAQQAARTTCPPLQAVPQGAPAAPVK